MPLVNTPDEPEKVEPNLVINPTPYESQVVDTKRDGYDAIATYLAGSKLACDWYKQLLGRDAQASSFQADLPFAYGQYHLIRGFELVVTSPLQIQQNQGDQRGFSCTGSALVYSILTPNMGDVFIADIGNGENAIFQITQSTRATIHEESATSIDFRASFKLNEERAHALNSRVSRRSIFNRENFRNGLKAILSEPEVDVLRRLNKAYSRLVNLYFRDFYNEQFKTLLLPDQALPTYDPYLANYVKAIVDPHSHPRAAEFTLLGMGGDPLNDQQSIFDMILNRDPELLYSCAHRMGVADICEYRSRPLFNGIYFSGVRQVVTPKDPSWNTDSPGYQGHFANDIADAGYREDSVQANLPNLDLTGPADKPAERVETYPVTVDDYYVLSKRFYDGQEGMSVLEQQLHDRLNDLSVDLGELAVLADNAHKWRNLERFYYIPIVLTLIKLAPGAL